MSMREDYWEDSQRGATEDDDDDSNEWDDEAIDAWSDYPENDDEEDE